MKIWIAIVIVAACSGRKDEPEARPHVESPAAKKPVDTITMTLPDGWTAKYDAAADNWLLSSQPMPEGTTTVVFERAPDAITASPEANLHHLRTKQWPTGTTATIESRSGVKGGFAMTMVVRPAADPDHPLRETHVIRQLGQEWYRCTSTPIADDAMRDRVVSLCTSFAWPK